MRGIPGSSPEAARFLILRSTRQAASPDAGSSKTNAAVRTSASRDRAAASRGRTASPSRPSRKTRSAPGGALGYTDPFSGSDVSPVAEKMLGGRGESSRVVATSVSFSGARMELARHEFLELRNARTTGRDRGTSDKTTTDSFSTGTWDESGVSTYSFSTGGRGGGPGVTAAGGGFSAGTWGGASPASAPQIIHRRARRVQRGHLSLFSTGSGRSAPVSVSSDCE